MKEMTVMKATIIVSMKIKWTVLVTMIQVVVQAKKFFPRRSVPLFLPFPSKDGFPLTEDFPQNGSQKGLHSLFFKLKMLLKIIYRYIYRSFTLAMPADVQNKKNARAFNKRSILYYKLLTLETKEIPQFHAIEQT